MRDICSSFNLVDELNSVLASLTMEAKHMQSVKARAEANSTIKELTDFVDKVSKEEPANKPKGHSFQSQLGKAVCGLSFVSLVLVRLAFAKTRAFQLL